MSKCPINFYSLPFWQHRGLSPFLLSLRFSLKMSFHHNQTLLFTTKMYFWKKNKKTPVRSNAVPTSLNFGNNAFVWDTEIMTFLFSNTKQYVWIWNKMMLTSFFSSECKQKQGTIHFWRWGWINTNGKCEQRIYLRGQNKCVQIILVEGWTSWPVTRRLRCAVKRARESETGGSCGSSLAILQSSLVHEGEIYDIYFH